MIIDAHTHIFSPGVIKEREKYFDDSTFKLLNNKESRVIDHYKLLDAMDESGIDAAIAMGFPWKKAKYCEIQNEYFSEVIKSNGNRIYTFGSVPMKLKGIEERVKMIKGMGLSGIGEVAFYEGFTKKCGKILEKIFSAASSNNLPVCLHLNEPIGHVYMGKYETDFKRLYSIIEEHRGLTLILAHWGGGILFYELMPEVKELFKNVYYDTAASPFLYKNDIYKAAIGIVGSEKIIFGSDFPLLKFKRYIEPVKNLLNKEEDKNNILANNIKRILGVD